MREPNKLLVHQKAHVLAVRIDALCAHVSKRRHPGLSDQLVRAAPSVPANIAEGCAHSSRREFARFLQVALASCGEVAYDLTFARDTAAIESDTFVSLDSVNREVRRMLASLLRVVRDELTERDDEDSVAAMQLRRTLYRTPSAAPGQNDHEPPSGAVRGR